MIKFNSINNLIKIQLVPPSPPTQSNNDIKTNIILNSVAVNHNVQNYIKELEISEGQLSSCIKLVFI